MIFDSFQESKTNKKQKFKSKEGEFFRILFDKNKE